jgi:hypothetical protein
MATTTVYFATNRVLNGPAEDWKSYGTSIVSPSDPTAITYAVAFVDNTEPTADKTGMITGIRDVEQGHFSDNVVSDLREPGRNLLVFIHGFDNDFEASITRAAFNREWLASKKGGCSYQHPNPAPRPRPDRAFGERLEHAGQRVHAAGGDAPGDDRAEHTLVAVPKARGSDQMLAPTIEPTTIMVSANSENFCVCSEATAAGVGAPNTASRLSIATSSPTARRIETA